MLVTICKKKKNSSDTVEEKTQGEKKEKKKHKQKWNKNGTTIMGILNLSHSKHNTSVTLDVLQEILKVREAEV